MSDYFVLEGSERVIRALQNVERSVKDPSPLYHKIAEYLVKSTKARFKTATAPDGSPWAVNSPVTVDRYLGNFKSSYNKDGSRSSKGRSRAGNKRIGIGETKALSSTINSIIYDDGLEVGSPMVYAPTFHFGAKKGQFGRAKNGSPLPWGDIPSRKFVGLSPADESEIELMAKEFLQGDLK